jgi:hypothetical protein
MRRPGPDTRSTAALGGRLRELSGYEEDLALQQPGGAARLANEVLARCCVAPGKAPGPWRKRIRALPLIERDRLLLELRRRSLGDTVRCEVDCPTCGRASEVTFRISELPLAGLVAREVAGELADGTVFRLRPLTAGDQEDLHKNGARDRESEVDATLACVLAQWGDCQGPFSPDDISAQPVHVREQLTEALDRANPAPDIRLSLRCNGCGRELGAPFDAESFFLPS